MSAYRACERGVMWEFVLGMLAGAVLTGALAGVVALGTLEKLFEERERFHAHTRQDH